MEQHIKRCERCIRFKAKQEIAPLENIEASYSEELVYIDYLTVMMGWNGRVYNFNSSHKIAPNEECTGSHDPQRLH